MPLHSLRRSVVLAVTLVTCVLIDPSRASEPTKVVSWDAAGAARYLDKRLEWWRAWPKAKRDHGTSCISCHTALPVALARPALRQSLGERGLTASEQAMYADITKRVRMWRDVEPFYSDQKSGLPKTSESRAVEAVLNALFLVTRDNEATGSLSEDTRKAFAQMWALQMQSGPLNGGFAWLNFRYEPFESETASYFGASLAAIAVARAPDNYAGSPEIAENVAALRDYLRTAFDGRASLYTRATVLWAEGSMPGILSPQQKLETVQALLAAQNPDGGWSPKRLASWQRRDNTIIGDDSDGLITAMITLALKDAGVSAKERPMKAARNWLMAHQSPESGGLPATSVNKLRDPTADAYLFMTDAATGFATLALLDNRPTK